MFSFTRQKSSTPTAAALKKKTKTQASNSHGNDGTGTPSKNSSAQSQAEVRSYDLFNIEALLKDKFHVLQGGSTSTKSSKRTKKIPSTKENHPLQKQQVGTPRSAYKASSKQSSRGQASEAKKSASRSRKEEPKATPFNLQLNLGNLKHYQLGGIASPIVDSKVSPKVASTASTSRNSARGNAAAGGNKQMKIFKSYSSASSGQIGNGAKKGTTSKTSPLKGTGSIPGAGLRTHGRREKKLQQLENSEYGNVPDDSHDLAFTAVDGEIIPLSSSKDTKSGHFHRPSAGSSVASKGTTESSVESRVPPGDKLHPYYLYTGNQSSLDGNTEDSISKTGIFSSRYKSQEYSVETRGDSVVSRDGSRENLCGTMKTNSTYGNQTPDVIKISVNTSPDHYTGTRHVMPSTTTTTDSKTLTSFSLLNDTTAKTVSKGHSFTKIEKLEPRKPQMKRNRNRVMRQTEGLENRFMQSPAFRNFIEHRGDEDPVTLSSTNNTNTNHSSDIRSSSPRLNDSKSRDFTEKIGRMHLFLKNPYGENSGVIKSKKRRDGGQIMTSPSTDNSLKLKKTPSGSDRSNRSPKRKYKNNNSVKTVATTFNDLKKKAARRAASMEHLDRIEPVGGDVDMHVERETSPRTERSPVKFENLRPNSHYHQRHYTDGSGSLKERARIFGRNSEESQLVNPELTEIMQQFRGKLTTRLRNSQGRKHVMEEEIKILKQTLKFASSSSTSLA